MNVLLLCRKFKKDKSMKKGRFSLLGIVALFLGLILVSCSDDDDQGGVIDTGIHKIVVEQSGDIDAFELGLVFGAVNTTSGPTKLYDEDGKYLGESHSVTRMEDAKVSCQTGDDAFFMTCAGSVTSTSDVSGKKLKVLVTAYIDGKEVVSVSAMLPLLFKQEYLALSSKKDESRNSFSPYSRSLQGTFA